MSNKPDKLIADFKEQGWQVPNLYDRLFELCDNPLDIFSFCRQFLLEFEDSITLFNDALSYLNKENFEQLIVLALEIIKNKKNKNENAAEVIAYASLQFPNLLHQHLDILFKIKPNDSSYYSEYPWRDLPLDKAIHFKNKLTDHKTKRHKKDKLFRCLLETRNPEIVAFAYEFAKKNDFVDIDKENLVFFLEDVGFTIRANKIERYCSEKVRHFNFKRDYFLNKKPIQLKKHPTWHLTSEKETYNFGGVITNDNTNPFTHIITLSPILKDLGITGINDLTLGLHINEINEGYGEVFYTHDSLGKPNLIGELHDIESSKDLALKPTTVQLANTPARWKYQSWGSANSRENLFRIGGEPTWIQSAQVLKCPKCDEKMNFLLQLDTAAPDTDGNELYFGSGGICYAFWCEKDKVSGYLMQWT